MTIEQLNDFDRASFVATLGSVFEHSPWVAERVFTSRPFSEVRALHQAMILQVGEASYDEQLALLRAHPDLGTLAKLSQASASEQASAGLDQLTPEEFDVFTALNHRYKEKFGFPFLYAVRGSKTHDILAALERRLRSGSDDEFAAALRQVYRIAAFRLQDLFETEI